MADVSPKKTNVVRDNLNLKNFKFPLLHALHAPTMPGVKYSHYNTLIHNQEGEKKNAIFPHLALIVSNQG